MKRANITEAKNERLARLVLAPIVRPRNAACSGALFKSSPAPADGSASVLEALIEERREGR